MSVKTYLPVKIMSFLLVLYITAKGISSYSGVILLRNISPSLPLGIYYQRNEISWKKGEIVSIELPPEIKTELSKFKWFRADSTLLKVVAGLPGDRICRTKNRIKINGRSVGKVYKTMLAKYSKEQQPGCFKLKNDEFLPINKDYRRSVDGRYFGAIKKRYAKGHVSPFYIYKIGSEV